VPILDSKGNLKPGRTPKTCSPRCRKRMQLRLPNVPNTRRPRTHHTDLAAPQARFRPGWVPLHPVDPPTVHGYCAQCREPLYRRGQITCDDYCRGHRSQANVRRLKTLRAMTLINDAIDTCQQCNDNGRLADGTICDHT
jgi:hypothetical protein